MNELVLATEDADILRRELLEGGVEKCAILFTNHVAGASPPRTLVRELQLAEPKDYTTSGPLEAELKPEFVARVAKKAKVERLGLVFVHTHPGREHPQFSRVDAEGEVHLSRFLSHRLPDAANAALVMSAGGIRARELGSDREINVIEVGDDRKILSPSLQGEPHFDDAFDRQVRAFGAAGQKTLERLRIGIVGLGGVGSIVSQELAHLGARDFTLVDPDLLEPSNLNRVANARPIDVGSPKIEIAARYVRSVAPGANVILLAEDVTLMRVASALRDLDFLFCCTDSHGSRSVLQQLAYQYLIPCIDIGTTIEVSADIVRYVFGRVQLLSPGRACLTCEKLLDPAEVRRDLMSPFERQQDPYFRGARVPAPAVMSLNGTVASLAVTMFLSTVTGVPSRARHLLYDATLARLRSVKIERDPACYVCSRRGALARGDSWPVPGRQG